MSQDRFEAIFSALDNDVRRSIVLLLAESGPQSYTTLLKKFNLKTGSLNHHLKKLVQLVEQDEQNRYILKKEGQIAYMLLKNAKELVAAPSLPEVKRREIPKIFKNYLTYLFRLVFNPVHAFDEADENFGAYTLSAITVLLALFGSVIVTNRSILPNLSIQLIAFTIFAYIFQRLVYHSKGSVKSVGLVVAMASLPYIPLNAISLLDIGFGELPSLIEIPFIEEPLRIGLTQLSSLLFIWRFALLFLGMRDFCRLTSVQSFMVVFTSTFFESLMFVIMGGIQIFQF